MANKAGLDRIVYKATAGDIIIPGFDVLPDLTFEIDRLRHASAAGVQRTTGNKNAEFEIKVRNDSFKAAIEADNDLGQDLEFYELGNTGPTADITIPNVNLIVKDNFVGDPKSEEVSGLILIVDSAYLA